MSKNSRKVKDDSYYVKKNDIDAIRKRPTMYVGHLGPKGVLHCCKEIIDNNADECNKEDSNGDSIAVYITDQEITTIDNGRGIPTNMLRTVFETMQAGSNMERAGGATRGENGAGSSCVLALSSYLKVTTIRPSEHLKLTLEYKEAELVGDPVYEKYDGDEHGLIVTFRPSKKILGTSIIPVDELVSWIEEMTYTMPKNISIKYTVNGKEHHIIHKELHEFFETSLPVDQQLGAPLMIKCKGNAEEIINEIPYNRTFDVEAAIVYSDPETFNGDDIRHSWMNSIYTSQNGSHVTGIISGFSKYINEKICAKNKKYENEDLKKDILAHLNLVAKVNTTYANMFTSQSKERVDTKKLGNAIADAVYNTLSSTYNSAISEMVEIVIGNHRARIEGEKARSLNSITREKKKWTQPDSFYPCSSVKTDMPKEIFLVEGESAGGGLKLARDAKFQALLTFRGKSLNVMKGGVDAIKALKSLPLMNLVQVLGCGIGENFDIKKLKYEKVLIATDADIDGHHIRVILLTFFLRFMPDLIREGRVYVVEPPLFELKQGKNKMYVASQREYLDRCIDSIGDLSVEFPMMKNVNVGAKEFVRDAFDYRTQISEQSHERLANRYLLEHIANGYAKYGSSSNFVKHIDEWIRSLVNVFPEMGFDHKTNQLHATIDLTDQLVVIDDKLEHDLTYMIDVIKKYGVLIKFASGKNEPVSTTLLHFFECIEDMYPRIVQRYKGLGSSQPIITREIVTDPRTRRTIKITMNNINTYSRIEDLMGESKENMRNRKELMMNFNFTKDMLDN